MKKLIKGRICDTENSQEIGRYKLDLDVSDPKYWTATLYRLYGTEIYFLYGRGGPDSPFKSTRGEHPASGFKIQLFSRAHAFLWSRLHLPAPLLVEIFPDLCTSYIFGQAIKDTPVSN